MTTLSYPLTELQDCSEAVPVARTSYPGFDYLRVLFMISVVTGHANFAVTWAAHLEQSIGQGPNIWDYFYFNVQSIAVPTFILISCLLFCMKPVTWGRTRARLQKLAFLYIFWVGAWVYYTRPVIEMNFLSLLEFFLRGGGWLFYFIAVLILMTVQTACIAVISRKWQIVVFCVSACVLFATEWYLTADYRWLDHYSYWLPLCFVLIPSFAVWIATQLPRWRDDKRARWRWALLLLVLSVVAGFIEWYFSAPRELLDEYRRWMPKHARFSIQFAALALVILASGVGRQPGVLMRFLAKNSLGVYCLHGFVIGGFLKTSQSLIGKQLPMLVIPVACLGVIFACAIASEFLRNALRQRLI